MRERIKDYDRLLHIKESIDNVFEFMNGKTLNDLAHDKLLFYGVVKNIEIIGEASYILTKEFIESHPDTPWPDIIRYASCSCTRLLHCQSHIYMGHLQK